MNASAAGTENRCHSRITSANEAAQSEGTLAFVYEELGQLFGGLIGQLHVVHV
jgi:hypothetical protein